jgi:magnesium transporter
LIAIFRIACGLLPVDNAPLLQKVRYHQPGTAPATLIPSPEHVGRKPVISFIEYDAHSIEERTIERIDDIFYCIDTEKVSWINIDGLGDVELLKRLGEQFQIHPLALEDVLNTGQRPKIEDYNGLLFVLLHMIYEGSNEDSAEDELVFEQVSLFLSPKFVITIQEEPGKDVFGPVRQRLKDAGGNIRFMKSDYLAYALIDSVVDHYFPVIESLGDSLDELQDTVLEDPNRETIRELHDYKRAIAKLRRSVWPQREIVGTIMRDESGMVSDRTKPYFRDCYDHTLIILDLLESFRDVTAGVMDLYLSSLSMRTNEIMRVLTVISAIFIPLTFIVGVYGMNFDTKSPFNMPELGWAYGYPAVICLMLGIAIGMIVYFKRRKWL